jgi:hypothetical protein
MRTLGARVLPFLVVAAGCGSPAAQSPVTDSSSGDETAPSEAPPPSPPPAPAHLRIVHASPGAASASISVALDDAAPALDQLAFHQGSDYLEVDAGPHALVVRGVASIETGTTADRDAAPPEGAAAVRLFHALVGTDALDTCVAGAGPRDPATLLFGAVQYGALGAGAEGAPYVEISADGELALQIRAPHDTPCGGRVIGVARTALTPGTSHTLVIVGRASGRPRVERELVVCTEGEHASCIAVPITAR